uniref:Uncharacterized protein n=1 Tax=Candidatus Kentrum sp. FW TaxID=2126338 RepID=A0A450TJY4_9GAMM|nr:MAG: hypothetical protein BECKFW1821C_GA0114237_10132 [Candidatus Kentron sp. FW]
MRTTINLNDHQLLRAAKHCAVAKKVPKIRINFTLVFTEAYNWRALGWLKKHSDLRKTYLKPGS